ncbi:4-alpha-glucanotransferase [Rubrivivax sp. A210]|uniref:4-alpha-glucanotransferase n=1 Tax=Rubrivivax sp. A210 TaxID=2772301 RepID=UPI001919819F|nr:4-alpha-glucanotransferase [Rubrivivax sp. A210]CAD5366252.1 4-alpha-glucanotransferase [Rubrivivax sp. A210]
MRFPRASGVLLHPSSLPGPHGAGDLGPAAYHFVDWLVAGGQSLWQILPLGGLGPGNSPYMSSSAFAGNVLLIALDELQQRGWLDADDVAPVPGLDGERIDFAAMVPHRMERMARAAARFEAQATEQERAELQEFCAEHGNWLDDYALFMALAEHNQQRDWCEWDAPLATRKAAALRAARTQHAQRIAFWVFCQWCFYSQWARLKAYANDRGVRIVGDAPIFIAHQSAEVWAQPKLFELDEGGRPTVVAGVPPDTFSATGQRWGNPLYRWRAHAREGYAWWVERIRRSFELVDIVRIDHFRGFAGYWEIPASEPTAMNGRWVPGPGEALFEAIAEALGPLPIIAEDLGVITPDVDALRKQFDFPGMRILQFAWGEKGEAETRFLPHSHEADTVVYTGTHDNDTTLGWWTGAPEEIRHHLREYLATDGRDVAWDLIRAACASVGDMAIYPMQDVLSLGGEHRMNFPGKGEGNWGWRFGWQQVQPGHAQRLRRLCQLYERLPKAV